MLRAIVLKHAEFEGPARIAELVAESGCAVEIRSLHRGEEVPAKLERDDLLVVMGGPMGVGEIDAPEYPFLRREVDLLRSRIEQDAPVLGVCLGAQLLAHAAGARVYPMSDGPGVRRYEVGWAPIRFHLEQGDDALSGLPAEASALHWHGDTFDLPEGARLLASSAVCRNQAFRLGRRAFGLQFHCEVAREDVLAFLRADAEYLTRALGSDAADRLREQTDRSLDAARRVGDLLLRNVLRAMSTA